MLILSARVEGEPDLKTLCYETADLANQLGIGIDVAFKGQVIEARPAKHPHNLIQAFQRGTLDGDQTRPVATP